MDERYDLFKVNAQLITALRERQQELSETYMRLHTTYSNLWPAYNYMNLLITTIKDNPGLLEEWENFLAESGMPEPSWKDEYAVDRLKID